MLQNVAIIWRKIFFYMGNNFFSKEADSGKRYAEKTTTT